MEALKKKIAIVENTINNVGGRERVSINLANSLTENFDVYIICFYKGNTECPYYINEEVKIFYLNEFKGKRRKAIVKYIIQTRNLIKSLCIDIIIAAGRNAIPIIPIASIGLNIKNVFWEHVTLSSKYIETTNYQKIIFDFITFIIVNFFNEIVVLTDSEKNNYINKCGANSLNVHTVPNLIDDDVILSDGKKKKRERKIISVGRIASEKNYESIIRVAAKVLAEKQNWVWEVYGDGDEKYLNKLIQYKNIFSLDRLIFKGKASDLKEIYSNASLLVLTSKYESFGLVLVESKLNGIPAIAFNVDSGPRDIISDGLDGFLIKPFDEDLMANKICYLISDESLLQMFSDNCYDNADKFKNGNILKKWIKLLL